MLLFVYGTLMRNLPSPMSAYLEANAEFVGEALAAGQLYDLGQYPGFVYDPRSADRVSGHVFRLRKAEAVLRELDRYEGINPDRPSPADEYRRSHILVSLNGEVQWAQSYLYQGFTQGLLTIPGGDYRVYYHQQERHRRFMHME